MKRERKHVIPWALTPTVQNQWGELWQRLGAAPLLDALAAFPQPLWPGAHLPPRLQSLGARPLAAHSHPPTIP